ncbi:uncharacterized protein MONBRDRAFT_38400 [Monosiga brevicollis MX1]|uniref:Protein kinase domain-containing protein n=1 Tax=Monosiga brevicollis TaxID=81824 RepID=A9V7I9_MONBE|nr:uncharacterized protein MONBRDRAFT_38400 [Monosiga brevicollis MX1]EDQ86523.1 predicted protein [Monosiga brevicollis MX1]|eukprot:XP_001748636.1 hypothetical protein [Monosiga brevicollis MX1]
MAEALAAELSAQMLATPCPGLDENSIEEEAALLKRLAKSIRDRRQFCSSREFVTLFAHLAQHRLAPMTPRLAELASSTSTEVVSFEPPLVLHLVQSATLLRILARDPTLLGNVSGLPSLALACMDLGRACAARHRTTGLSKPWRVIWAEASCLLVKASEDNDALAALATPTFERELLRDLSGVPVTVQQNNLLILLALARSDEVRERLGATEAAIVCIELLQDSSTAWSVSLAAARLLARLADQAVVQDDCVTHGMIHACILQLQDRNTALLLPTVQILEHISPNYQEEVRAAGAIPALIRLLQRFGPELPPPPSTATSTATGRPLLSAASRPTSSRPTSASVRPSSSGGRDTPSDTSSSSPGVAGGRPMVTSLLCSTCSVLTDLARSEINAVAIQEANAIFLAACLLITSIQLTDADQSETARQSAASRLMAYVLRLLRFLFSVARNRRFFKRMFPPDLFADFIDVGHYQYDLNKYRIMAKVILRMGDRARRRLHYAVLETSVHNEPIKRINNYQVFEILGSGSFGSVYRAKQIIDESDSKAGRTVALKEMPLKNPLLFGSTDAERSHSLKLIENEISIMENAKLKHPNVVKYMDSFVDGSNLYVVMEMVEGASLQENVNALKEKGQTFRETRIWRIAIQIVNGLRYIHKDCKVVHRDVTPNNIMLGWYDKVTIIDFGLARKGQTGSTLMQSSVGTLCYSCPEIVTGAPYGAKSDIWSLGCIFYQLATLEPPFNTTNMLALAKRIVEARYPPLPDTQPELLRNVIDRCLTADAAKRPDIDEVCHLLGPVIMREYNDAVLTLEVKDRIISQERSLKQRLRTEAQEQKSSFRNLLRMAHGSAVNGHGSRLPSVLESPGALSSSMTSNLFLTQRGVGSASASMNHGAGALRSASRNGRGSGGSGGEGPISVRTEEEEVFDEGGPPEGRSRAASERSEAGLRLPTSASSTMRHSRPASGIAKTLLIPTQELRPIQDPTVSLLQPLHKLVFVCNRPAPRQADPARHVITHFRRELFASGPTAFRTHLQRLSQAADAAVGIDFGPAAAAVRQWVEGPETSEGIEPSFDGNTTRMLKIDPDMVDRHSLTYRQLRQLIEQQANVLGYYDA